ncbi:ABC-2 type transporter [Musa troglodytarum]|uniref:ABC-2 type transporter n=1 Tax=Musa troglodytarum TaxID=320322 RepID=A0A9E7G8H4_9LILI|nr:ABC-2 type transporter [Musa troglodytarum]
MIITKIVIEKFDRNINFGMWQLKMEAILVQNGVDLALHGVEKILDGTSKEDLAGMDKKARSSIILNLFDEVLQEVATETTAKNMWDKLKALYMKRIVENHLYLKQSLYMLWITEEEIGGVGEPTTYSNAVSCDDSAKWLIALNKEIESLHQNRTWDLMKLPSVAMYDLELEQLDVKSTFLHGELEEQIYIKQPHGFEVDGVALIRLMMIVASIVPDFLIGIITGAGIQGVMMLNGGFFRLPIDLPKPVWRYPMYYIAFHKYANQGFYKNEFLGLIFPNTQAGGPPTINGDEILRETWQVEMGYSKWIDLVILFGMVILYRLMFLGIVTTVEKVKPMIKSFMVKAAEKSKHVMEQSSFETMA